MGNYRGFGDSKFVPNLPMEKLEKLIQSSAAYKNDQAFIDFVWKNASKRIFSLQTSQLNLGFPPNGTSTYWSSNITEEDANVVKKFLEVNVSVLLFCIVLILLLFLWIFCIP